MLLLNRPTDAAPLIFLFQDRRLRRAQLDGPYVVESFARVGRGVPPVFSEAGRWRKFVFSSRRGKQWMAA